MDLMPHRDDDSRPGGYSAFLLLQFGIKRVGPCGELFPAFEKAFYGLMVPQLVHNVTDVMALESPNYG